MAKAWLPLESNPDVLNDYLRTLGLTEPKIGFYDVYGLDPELLAMVPRKIHAFLLLYPISDAVEQGDAAALKQQEKEGEKFMADNKFFYSKQTISNACGTMGVLHAVLNNMAVAGKVEAGSTLDEFFSKTKDMSPEERARFIESSSTLDEAHSAAASAGVSEKPPVDADVDLHFTCFVRIGGYCVELDGRKSRPLLHNRCSDEEGFVSAATAAILEKMNYDPASSRFNILALCDL
ncbi:putative Ubiquitin carboxyl terminal hydrolase family 1 [Trypanosoma vivax]|uniref:Ubiquitin carboxyl-terminal hydrolase n=1 Tax=Trypanosoma vivax (strain Y486) TaxID=1055687 RepID=G0U9P8_TRYVY|nr:putative ubiquitin carboxyl-terminal hydrolase [Trypanosoma vivax]KAH8619067.1 putative Ubiquitin carboxyl terminal hydrolase family 1 [Trypanosoma vivax]CCC52528.1 putative ubiquitin carboxyl-terminal hydrolase [Trypanosoma vivax Y486]